MIALTGCLHKTHQSAFAGPLRESRGRIHNTCRFQPRKCTRAFEWILQLKSTQDLVAVAACSLRKSRYHVHADVSARNHTTNWEVCSASLCDLLDSNQSCAQVSVGLSGLNHGSRQQPQQDRKMIERGVQSSEHQALSRYH